MFANVKIFTTTKEDGSVKNFSKSKNKPSIIPTIISQKTNLKRKYIIEMNQVHGNDIFVIDSKIPTKISDCDGLITNKNDIALLVKTADCLPIIFFDRYGHYAAAIHAGWRGLVAGIHTKTINKISSIFGAKPEQLHAYIGPSIRSCCYKFKDKPTQAKDKNWVNYIDYKNNYYHIDLQGFLKNELIKNGFNLENIIDSKECTYHQQDKYFSHLRHKHTKESSGTMATVVQLQP